MLLLTKKKHDGNLKTEDTTLFQYREFLETKGMGSTSFSRFSEWVWSRNLCTDPLKEQSERD